MLDWSDIPSPAEYFEWVADAGAAPSPGSFLWGFDDNTVEYLPYAVLPVLMWWLCKRRLGDPPPEYASLDDFRLSYENHPGVKEYLKAGREWHAAHPVNDPPDRLKARLIADYQKAMEDGRDVFLPWRDDYRGVPAWL